MAKRINTMFSSGQTVNISKSASYLLKDNEVCVNRELYDKSDLEIMISNFDKDSEDIDVKVGIRIRSEGISQPAILENHKNWQINGNTPSSLKELVDFIQISLLESGSSSNPSTPPTPPVDLTPKLDALISKTKEIISAIKEISQNSDIKDEILKQGNNNVTKLEELKKAINEGTLKTNEVKIALLDLQKDINKFKEESVKALTDISEDTSSIKDLLEQLVKLSEPVKVKNTRPTSSIIHTINKGIYNNTYSWMITNSTDVFPKNISFNPEKTSSNVLDPAFSKEVVFELGNNNETFSVGNKTLQGQKILKSTIAVLKKENNFNDLIGGFVGSTMFGTKQLIYLTFKKHGSLSDKHERIGAFGVNGDYIGDDANYIGSSLVVATDISKYRLEFFYDNDGNLTKTDCYDGTTANGVPNTVPIPKNYIEGEPESKTTGSDNTESAELVLNELKKDRNTTSSIIHVPSDEMYVEVPLFFDENAVVSGDPANDDEVTIEMIPNYGLAVPFYADVLLKIEKTNSFRYDKSLVYDVLSKKPFDNFNTNKEAYKLHEDSIGILRSLPTYENLEDAYYLGVVDDSGFSLPLYGLILRFKTAVTEDREFYGVCSEFEPFPFEPKPGWGDIYTVKYEEYIFAKYILEHVYDNDNKLLETNCYDGTTTNGIPNKVAVPEKFVPGEPVLRNEGAAWVVSSSIAHKIDYNKKRIYKYLLETHENKVTGKVKLVWYELVYGEKVEIGTPEGNVYFGEPSISDVLSTGAKPLLVSVVDGKDFEIVSREVCVPAHDKILNYRENPKFTEVVNDPEYVYEFEIKFRNTLLRRPDNITVNIEFKDTFTYNDIVFPRNVTLKELMVTGGFMTTNNYNDYETTVIDFIKQEHMSLVMDSAQLDSGNFKPISYEIIGHYEDKTLEIRHFYKNGELYETKAYDGLTEVDIPEEVKSGRCCCKDNEGGAQDKEQESGNCKDPYFVMKHNGVFSGDVENPDSLDSIMVLSVDNPKDISWEIISGKMVVYKEKIGSKDLWKTLTYSEDTIRGASFEDIEGYRFIFQGEDFTVHWKCGTSDIYNLT